MLAYIIRRIGYGLLVVFGMVFIFKNRRSYSGSEKFAVLGPLFLVRDISDHSKNKKFSGSG